MNISIRVFAIRKEETDLILLFTPTQLVNFFTSHTLFMVYVIHSNIKKTVRSSYQRFPSKQIGTLGNIAKCVVMHLIINN